VKFPAADHVSLLEWLALAAILGLPIVLLVILILHWLN